MSARRGHAGVAPRCVRARGLSLVELMIAMAIALALTVVASYAYLGSKQTYRAGDEQNELYEEARFALGTLGQQIKSAGYSPAVEPPTAQALTAFSSGYVPRAAINGCDSGFNTADRRCEPSGTQAPDALYIAYATDNPAVNNNAAFGVGVDCTGRNAVATVMANGETMYLVENWFYLEDASFREGGVTRTRSQLTCRGNGGVAQPLFKGVEDMQILFGVSSDITRQAADQLLTAREVATGGLWENVVSVQVCLLMETIAAGVSVAAGGAVNHTDCNGRIQPQPPGLVRRAFTNTFNLRNRVTQ